MTNKEHHYENPDYLVETDWLESHINDADLRVFDCSVYVEANPDKNQATRLPFIFHSGLKNYQQHHIPRAGFIDIPSELSDTEIDLPLMMPPQAQFVAAMNRLGIDEGTRVVLYSTTEPNWAARMWWMLRAFGFVNAAILNGGWNKWISEDRPSSSDQSDYPIANFVPRPSVAAITDKHKVVASVDDSRTRIINALPAPLHSGTSDIYFGRKGRISNSVNIPFNELHNPDNGCYLPASQLQKLFDSVDVNDADHIINYCGGGIASANNAFALSLLGYENISVYDGSMLEWGNDHKLPMQSDT